MTAAYVTELGAADRIRVGPLPVPPAGPSDILVRVQAVAVNHVDTFVRSGAYRMEISFPFVVGRDLVGTVVCPAASGPGAVFPAGARVWCNSLGYGGRQGSFAEYAVVPGDRLYPLPDGVDPAEAVSVLHTGATAHIGLFREARIEAGQTVVVSNVGGGVGSAVTQLATAAGARVIAVDRARSARWCRDCGASAVVDPADPQAASRIAALAPSGADVWWDNSGQPDFDAMLPLLARGGRLVLVAGLQARAMLPVGAVYTRDISIHGFAISNASVGDLAVAAEMINMEMASGRLRGRIRATLGLADAAKAHLMQETRTPDEPPGRIVLLP